MAPVCPWVNDPACDLATVRSGVPLGGTTVVGSDAVSLEVLVSPPPETATEFVTDAAALAATLTESVMTGKVRPAASTVLVVQVSVARVHPHPEPLMAVAVRPAGNVSTTVTVPLVEPVPEFLAVMV